VLRLPLQFLGDLLLTCNSGDVLIDKHRGESISINCPKGNRSSRSSSRRRRRRNRRRRSSRRRRRRRRMRSNSSYIKRSSSCQSRDLVLCVQSLVHWFIGSLLYRPVSCSALPRTPSAACVRQRDVTRSVTPTMHLLISRHASPYPALTPTHPPPHTHTGRVTVTTALEGNVNIRARELTARLIHATRVAVSCAGAVSLRAVYAQSLAVASERGPVTVGMLQGAGKVPPSLLVPALMLCLPIVHFLLPMLIYMCLLLTFPLLCYATTASAIPYHTIPHYPTLSHPIPSYPTDHRRGGQHQRAQADRLAGRAGGARGGQRVR
jgi:hypothetical protein